MKNEIGTDPTMVDVIETLDVPVPEKKIEPKNENKQNNNDNLPNPSFRPVPKKKQWQFQSQQGL